MTSQCSRSMLECYMYVFFAMRREPAVVDSGLIWVSGTLSPCKHGLRRPPKTPESRARPKP